MANGIGTKIYKENIDWDKYADEATWCNESGMGTIEDKGSYYEVVPIPQPSLSELKAAKLVELKGERDKRELMPVSYNDHLFDFDQKSYERITAAIYALDVSGGTINWTTADNSTVEVTANDLRGVIASAAVRSNALHIRYRLYKERLDAALTPSEVKEIVWVDG